MEQEEPEIWDEEDAAAADDGKNQLENNNIKETSTRNSVDLIKGLVFQMYSEALTSTQTLERLVQLGHKEKCPSLPQIFAWRREFRGDTAEEIDIDDVSFSYQETQKQDADDVIFIAPCTETSRKRSRRHSSSLRNQKHCKLCNKSLSSRQYYETHMARTHRIVVGYTKVIFDIIDRLGDDERAKCIYRCEQCDGGLDFHLFEDFGSHKREFHGVELKFRSPRTLQGPRISLVSIKKEITEPEEYDEDDFFNIEDGGGSSSSIRRSSRVSKPTSVIRESFELLQTSRLGGGISTKASHDGLNESVENHIKEMVYEDADSSLPYDSNEIAMNRHKNQKDIFQNRLVVMADKPSLKPIRPNLQPTISILVDMPCLEKQENEPRISSPKKGYLIVPQRLGYKSLHKFSPQTSQIMPTTAIRTSPIAKEEKECFSPQTTVATEKELKNSPRKLLPPPPPLKPKTLQKPVELVESSPVFKKRGWPRGKPRKPKVQFEDHPVLIKTNSYESIQNIEETQQASPAIPSTANHLHNFSSVGTQLTKSPDQLNDVVVSGLSAVMPTPLAISYSLMNLNNFNILDHQIEFGYIAGQLKLHVKNDNGHIVFYMDDFEQKSIAFSNERNESDLLSGNDVLVSEILEGECVFQESWSKSGGVSQFIDAVRGRCYKYFFIEPKSLQTVSTTQPSTKNSKTKH